MDRCRTVLKREQVSDYRHHRQILIAMTAMLKVSLPGTKLWLNEGPQTSSQSLRLTLEADTPRMCLEGGTMRSQRFTNFREEQIFDFVMGTATPVGVEACSHPAWYNGCQHKVEDP